MPFKEASFYFCLYLPVTKGDCFSCEVTVRLLSSATCQWWRLMMLTRPRSASLISLEWATTLTIDFLKSKC